MNLDLTIVIGYLLITLLIGFLFQKIGQSSISSYFRGGGGMAWWMVGATAFMTQFSAVTFTAMAAKAYSGGITVIAVFVGNLVGFLASYFFFAAKYRQVNLDTGGEIVRARYGKANEQFFTWTNIPNSLISTGLWLNALSIFVAAILGWSVPTVIIVVGVTVTIISVLSGSWGIVASDFVQGILVMIVSIFMAGVALFKIGGINNMVTSFPNGFIMGDGMNYGIIVFGSFLFYIIRQIQTNNTMFASYRYLAARDTNSARKGALLAAGLMCVGMLIWFIPAWASASLYPNAANEFVGILGSRSQEAVYVVFAKNAMPLGTTGLLVAALFAATMSSMDSSINRDTGIIIKSFYLPVLRKGKANNKEMMLVSIILSAVMGALAIGIGLFYDSLRGLSLFDLAMQLATLIQMPILVPLFFGMIIRKTPDWSGWTTALIGLFFSYLLLPPTNEVFLRGAWHISEISNFLGYDFTNRELADLGIIWNVIIHLVLTGGFFCLTMFFYKEPVGERKKELEQFYKNMDTPVIKSERDENQIMLDFEQRSKIGLLVMISGFMLSLLIFVPNPLWGRFMFGGTGAFMLLLGYFMWKVKKVETSTS